MTDSSRKNIRAVTDAAIELFRERGYENVSVNDICRAAGIARSTFYQSFAGKKEIVDRILSDVNLDRSDFFGEFIAAPNDFERMWILCCRYLTVAESFGPEVTGTLFRLELMGELDVLDSVHTVDEWMIQLTRNCQNSGVIQSREPPELLAPVCVDVAYHTTYEWCKRGGGFDLRELTRRRTEAVCGLAPQYRMDVKKDDVHK